MPEMDRQLLLEALSALTHATVKPLVLHRDSAEILTLQDFISTTVTLDSLFNKLSLGPSDVSLLRHELFVDVENFLDPKYDFDFRNFTGSLDCRRGGEAYRRPVGWYRFALNVKDKYPDGNAWLGYTAWRVFSEAGEWPVSFHGTSIEASKAIASSYYKAGPRQAYGRGVYSTPDITIADNYAMSKRFTSKKNGKTYKVIMQNRINPQNRRIIDGKNFWLIPVPEGSTAEQEKELIEKSIRPYGILIKEVAP